MDLLTILIVVVVILVLATLDDDPEPDPLDLARPSVEHLDAEAQRAMKELRQLDRNRGQ